MSHAAPKTNSDFHDSVHFWRDLALMLKGELKRYKDVTLPSQKENSPDDTEWTTVEKLGWNNCIHEFKKLNPHLFGEDT